MTVSEIVTILAIILAPVFAVQVQKWLEGFRERRRSRGNIFHALMATRDARVSAEHVRALNMIDIAYSGRKVFRWTLPTQTEKVVLAAWTEYRDQLNTQFNQEDLNTWIAKCNELFVDLLHAMSNSLGYQFDKVLLKKGCYTPIAHGDTEFYRLEMQRFMLNLANGERTFPVSIARQSGAADASNSEATLSAPPESHGR